tara:strand:- start:76 stop:2253 length:2178 start_codon:yes stop_codon:yes gene_type:complete
MDEQQLKQMLNEAFSASDIKKFKEELRKSADTTKNITAQEKKNLEKLLKSREELIKASTNLRGHFTKFGKSVGMTDYLAVKFGKGLETTAGFTGKLGKAMYEGTGQIQDFTDTLKEFGPIGDMLARLGSTIGGSLDMYRTLSDVGASFSQNLITMRETAARAGLPLEDFANMIGKNSEELAKLFGTTSQGAIEFSNLSRQLRTTYIQDLAPLGLTVEQLNEQLLTSFTLNRRSGTFQLMTDNQRIASGAALIKQMDRLAKLTGAQRDAIAEQLEAQLSNARFLAAIGDMPKEIRDQMQLFSAGIATIAPDLETGLLDLIANSGVPVTQAAQDLVKTIPGATDIIKQLEAGTIDNVTAMKLLQIEAQKSQEMFRDVAKTGQVEFIDGMYVGVNQLATAVLDTAAATGEGAEAADKLTQELSEFQNAAKNLSSAFQGTETSFLKFIGDFLGTGTGSLNETMNNLADDIKGFSEGTQAAVYAAKEIVQTAGSMLRETAPITAGTYAALKLWGPLGPGYGGVGGGGKFMKNAGKVGGGAVGLSGVAMGGQIADQSDSIAGKALGVGSSAAGGALTGAMIGSVVPVLGTALGAAIGAGIGGLYGLFRASDYDDVAAEKLGLNGKSRGTVGTTGNLRETRTNLATIHAGERVLTKAETDSYLSSTATGGGDGAIQSMNASFNNMNTKMSAVVNEMKLFNKNVNTLVSLNTDVVRNTDKTQRRLANQTESIV